jgi:hypothetical protein
MTAPCHETLPIVTGERPDWITWIDNKTILTETSGLRLANVSSLITICWGMARLMDYARNEPTSYSDCNRQGSGSGRL